MILIPVMTLTRESRGNRNSSLGVEQFASDEEGPRTEVNGKSHFGTEKIRDDAKNGFYVENLSEEYVTSFEDATQILIKGLSNRKVGATSINSKSSRSLVVFICIIESCC